MPNDVFSEIDRQVSNEFAKEELCGLLARHDLNHLKVRSHGRHLVIYSEEPTGERVSRIRFTRVGEDVYELGVAHHTGRWSATSFTGTLQELFNQATSELGWLLAEF